MISISGGKIRRRDKRVWYVMLGVFAAVSLFTFSARYHGAVDNDAEAASLANFDPGYIISDWQMGNYNSMTEAEIQSFLWAKGKCYNTSFSAVGTRVDYFSDSTPPTTWHVKDGHTVCLAEEDMNGESAAHIIWQTAQDYKINPQVLIVLLQKETGLITDPIPNSWDYQRAAGYGCPDTAACSSKYYGFKNQIRNAAALFRTVLDGGWTNYPLGDNYVQYNPNAACGGSVVNIRSLATSALYRYTPYQPNAGALAAGYGTAACGAYGNRNFYLYFQDWFGGITDTVKALNKDTIDEENKAIKQEKDDLGITYTSYVQNVGWLDNVNGGYVTGSSGHNLRMDSLKLQIAEEGKTGIEYRSHIQNIGWENVYKKDGEESGTPGSGLQIEAVQIRLTGGLEKAYDIYYRVHVQDIGWMNWVGADQLAGTTGRALKIEALQIKIVKKPAGVDYEAHVEDYGWMNWVKNGQMAGTTGQAKRVEALQIKLSSELAAEHEITYRTHVADYGWLNWVKNGEIGGTTGQAKRVEAIEIKLSDELAKIYDIQYRVHVEDYGWMNWVKNGEMAGTTGQAKRVEAIEIKLVAK